MRCKAGEAAADRNNQVQRHGGHKRAARRLFFGAMSEMKLSQKA